MDQTKIIQEISARLTNAVSRFEDELKKMRTGRAHPSMLDGIMVEAYGTTMPLNQLASITVPESQLLQVTPFDPTNLQTISTAIRDSQSLGLNPMDDGRVVRIPIPPLTEERRRELSKQVGAKLEDSMIAMRGMRHDALDAIDRAKKAKEIGEDDAKRLLSQVEEAMNKAKLAAEATAKTKEQEIMTV